jgi:hypothetical protein
LCINNGINPPRNASNAVGWCSIMCDKLRIANIFNVDNQYCTSPTPRGGNVGDVGDVSVFVPVFVSGLDAFLGSSSSTVAPANSR